MNIVSVIKDIVDILFLFLTGTLGILTYLKARKTILQPLKAETAKKQFELLSSMYDDFNKYPYLGMAFGYQDIVFLNTFKTLDEYGLIKAKLPLKNMLKEGCFAGMIFIENKGKVKTMERVSIFSDEKNKKSVTKEDLREELRKKAISGKVFIETISYPKNTYDFLSKLEGYSKSPFLPRKISHQLNYLQQEFCENLKIMKKTIELFVKDFAKRVNNKGNVKFEIDGIYNEFNKKSIKHRKAVDTILNEIRQHLCIDEGWL